MSLSKDTEYILFPFNEDQKELDVTVISKREFKLLSLFCNVEVQPNARKVFILNGVRFFMDEVLNSNKV